MILYYVRVARVCDKGRKPVNITIGYIIEYFAVNRALVYSR
jgi:hypothetical protein